MDEIPLSYLLVLLLVLILLSGFFSSSETGLMALNRYRLRHLANQGNRGARRAQALLERPDRLIGLILLGNNFVNIFASAIATIIGIRLLGSAGIPVATLSLTLLILIFAEVAPKTFAATRPERIAFPASIILKPLLSFFQPMVWGVNKISNGVLAVLGLRPGSDDQELLTSAELRTIVSESTGLLPRRHRSMLLNILDLEHVSVEEIMVPRKEIVGLDIAGDWETVLTEMTGSYYTRLPVFEDEVNRVLGILHVRTIITRIAAGDMSPESLHTATRKPYFIPIGTSLTHQLLEFQRREHRMAMVVDEYGEVQGLVTLDDILEEIVGEFTTEPKARVRHAVRCSDGSFQVEGAANIRTLNRRMGWQLPTEGARTLNGLLLEQLEELPTAGDQATFGNTLLTITEVEQRKVQSVCVRTVGTLSDTVQEPE